MRFSSTYLAITILAVLSICGCHLIFPFELKPVDPVFAGTFRGPIQSDFPTGSAMWGDTLEVVLKLEKVNVPPGQTKDHGPNISGTGTSFYANGQFKWKFLITGYVTKDKNNVANLTLEEAKTHKETTATATLKSPSYDTMDFVVEWPKGLTAKAELKRKSKKK